MGSVESISKTAHMSDTENRAVSVFVRVYEKEYRKEEYKRMNEVEKKQIKKIAFLPESSFPKIKGRVKYDFLKIVATPVSEKRGEIIKEYLEAILGREVFAVKRRNDTWIFYVSWRDPATGKALPNKMWFFRKLRMAIAELATTGTTNEKMVIS